jgi:hypothetical protein
VSGVFFFLLLLFVCCSRYGWCGASRRIIVFLTIAEGNNEEKPRHRGEARLDIFIKHASFSFLLCKSLLLCSFVVLIATEMN